MVKPRPSSRLTVIKYETSCNNTGHNCFPFINDRDVVYKRLSNYYVCRRGGVTGCFHCQNKASKFFRFKVLIRLNTSLNKYLNNYYKRIFFKFLYSLSDAIIVNSKFFQKELNELNLKSHLIFHQATLPKVHSAQTVIVPINAPKSSLP